MLGATVVGVVGAGVPGFTDLCGPRARMNPRISRFGAGVAVASLTFGSNVVGGTVTSAWGTPVAAIAAPTNARPERQENPSDDVSNVRNRLGHDGNGILASCNVATIALRCGSIND